jgi:hypothetical protein
MAAYVLLLKENENAEKVTYRFGLTEEELGLLCLNKINGSVEELFPVPTVDSQAVFPRAAVKVRQHWREGFFPKESCWAS